MIMHCDSLYFFSVLYIKRLTRFSLCSLHLDLALSHKVAPMENSAESLKACPASPKLSQILLDGRPMPGIRDGDVLLEAYPVVGDGIAEAETLSRLSELDVVAVNEAILREASINQDIALSEQQVVSLLFEMCLSFTRF